MYFTRYFQGLFKLLLFLLPTFQFSPIVKIDVFSRALFNFRVDKSLENQIYCHH